jgi:diaminopimelate decarboxylase
VSFFTYIGGALCVEDVPLAHVAERFGTPAYVYSRAALTSAFQSFDAAFAEREHLVCYAVKANSNLAILDLFARLGSGFDIVSGGELQRVLAAGGDPSKIVFSGVGKSAEELRTALEAGILCFNVESEGELYRLSRIAGELRKEAPVSLRVNPDVDAGTHPYIATGLKENKFGIAYADALALYRCARDLPHLRIDGIDCHIGSQLTDSRPIAEALEKIADLVERLSHEGIELSHIDVGGGIGIRYRDEQPLDMSEYAAAVLGAFRNTRHKLLFEPGRLLTGNSGVLLARVEYVKRGEDRSFAVVDAAMNDLMRPSLYDAWHDVLTVQARPPAATHTYDVVGPVCESGDFLARSRDLAISEGDLIAIMSAGAYGMSMASNYNTRARAVEVMADGEELHVIREREEIADLISRERLLPGT